jgi:hypothetical protein
MAGRGMTRLLGNVLIAERGMAPGSTPRAIIIGGDHPQLPMRYLALWRSLVANRPDKADIQRVRILPVLPF